MKPLPMASIEGVIIERWQAGRLTDGEAFVLLVAFELAYAREAPRRLLRYRRRMQEATADGGYPISEGG